MNKNLLLGILTLAASSLVRAKASPADDVNSAAMALGGAANYAWHAATESPGGGFGNGITDGKTEKDGYTWISMVRGDNTTEAVMKGANAAIKSPDAGWQTLAEATADNGGGFN